MNLPTHIGVTAYLNVNFKAPCTADQVSTGPFWITHTRSPQFVVMRTKMTKKDGRKVFVEGTMETLDGEAIASANGLFVEPKWAQFLQSSGVTEALGRPMPMPETAAGALDDRTERVI